MTPRRRRRGRAARAGTARAARVGRPSRSRSGAPACAVSPQIAGISGLDSASACGLSCRTTVSSAAGCGKWVESRSRVRSSSLSTRAASAVRADECRQANDVDADSVQDIEARVNLPVEARRGGPLATPSRQHVGPRRGPAGGRPRRSPRSPQMPARTPRQRAPECPRREDRALSPATSGIRRTRRAP